MLWSFAILRYWLYFLHMMRFCSRSGCGGDAETRQRCCGVMDGRMHAGIGAQSSCFRCSGIYAAAAKYEKILCSVFRFIRTIPFLDG